MQTTWIEAFLAVVDHRGFARAATHLYRSQGRVSSYVAALETELGVELLDRTTRPIRLTGEGAAFLPYARSLLESLYVGRTAALAVGGLARGDVDVATYPSAGAEYLPLVLTRFAERYPNIDVKLIEQQTRGLDRALDSGETTLAIRPTVPPPITRTPYRYQALWREPICVVVAEGHRLSGQTEVKATDLAGQPIVIGGQNTEDAEIVRLLSIAGVRPHVKYLSNRPQSIVALARHGLAIGIINAMALQSIRLDDVVVLAMPPNMTREVAVYWTPSAKASSAARALLKTILRTPPPAPFTDLRSTASTRHPDLFGTLTTD
jgi:DNA-binding transcriptional LysR family regulator